MKSLMLVILILAAVVSLVLLGFLLMWSSKNNLLSDFSSPSKTVFSPSLSPAVLTPTFQKNVTITKDQQPVPTMNGSYYSTNVDGK